VNFGFVRFREMVPMVACIQPEGFGGKKFRHSYPPCKRHRELEYPSSSAHLVYSWCYAVAKIGIGCIIRFLDLTMSDAASPSAPNGTPPPPPPPAPSSGSPSGFLKAVVGKRVVVRLVSGVDYKGSLVLP
jgi:hypothetical protein